MRIASSTLMKLRSVSTPAFSSPMPSVLPCTPAATSTLRHSSVELPSGDSTVRLTPPADLLTSVTLEPVRALMPCRSKDRSS